MSPLIIEGRTHQPDRWCRHLLIGLTLLVISDRYLPQLVKTD